MIYEDRIVATITEENATQYKETACPKRGGTFGLLHQLIPVSGHAEARTPLHYPQ